MILNPTYEELLALDVDDGLRVSILGNNLAVADGSLHSHEDMRKRFGFTGAAYIAFRHGGGWVARWSHSKRILSPYELPVSLRELLSNLNSILHHAKV